LLNRFTDRPPDNRRGFGRSVGVLSWEGGSCLDPWIALPHLYLLTCFALSPQGSVLGSLINTADLADLTSGHTGELHAFTDDMQTYLGSPTQSGLP